jgi:hypothetical protein
MLAEWAVGQVFWSLLWFTMFFIWIWLLIMVFADIFRSHDMNGWIKAIWCIFIIILPFLGVFVYLIARGGKMSQHAQEDAQRMDQAQRAYIQSVTSSGGSTADELAKLADLKAKGVITDADYDAAKAKILA